VSPGHRVTVMQMGDAALLLRWTGLGRKGDPAAIASTYRAIRSARIPGVIDVVPAPASVMVRFDPLRVTEGELKTRLPQFAASRAGVRSPRKHRVALRYGGEEGPDIDEVADRLGLSVDEVIRRHSTATYTVLATGFSPGFVYLGPVVASLRLARREDPRLAVPSGSVALADAQTGIYGVRSGGGWWLIGRAAVPTFRADRRPPTPFEIGDQVEFEAEP